MVQYAVHVYNQTPVKHLDWRTPYKVIYGKEPDVSHLRVFGSGAYVLIPEERRVNKLSPRSELMTFSGIDEGMK